MNDKLFKNEIKNKLNISKIEKHSNYLESKIH